jgi:tellurite methyltransferase
MNIYDDKYKNNELYWGKQPSSICLRVLELLPPEKGKRLIDIGCGEGRNAIFFAKNGYEVSAFDLSPIAVEKTKKYAKEADVEIRVFQEDISSFELVEEYQIIFSTGTLQYIPQERRNEIIQNYKEHTEKNGINAFSVLVEKPFIPKAPDQEPTARMWISGEIFQHYHDWKIEHCNEEIFNCHSIEIPHQHAVNRIIARKIL